MTENIKKPVVDINEQSLINNYNAFSQVTQHNDEINLLEIWRAIWAGKLIIIIFSIAFCAVSVFYALKLPNVYKASTILAPVEKESSAGGLSSQFGGLASLAGINLQGGGSNKTIIALEVLKSRSFIEAFIKKHDLLVPLMASKGWRLKTDELLINGEVYDKETNKWLRAVEFPKTPEPSLWEAYVEFIDILSISEDKDTAMINISIEFYSPNLAKNWLASLIEDINLYIREIDKKEAQDSINYLTSKLKEINVSAMETVFYQLIEEQTKNMMLAEVKAEYVLKTIDPPQAPEIKEKPNRALIVILGTILGGILSLLIVLVRYFTKLKVHNSNDF